MTRYRMELHGHLIEVRHDSFSMGEVLVDGRPQRRSIIDALLDRPLRFEIKDERGTPRWVEIRWIQTARSLGFRHRLAISVDGIERAMLEPEPQSAGAGRCLNCGYALAGLTPVNGEVKCPECGRHTSARLAGLNEVSPSGRQDR